MSFSRIIFFCIIADAAIYVLRAFIGKGFVTQALDRYYHLFRWEILHYNDLKASEELLPGTIVYLDQKKSKAPKGLEKYIVSADGESFHAICQRFAVRENVIRRRNGFPKNPELHEGDEIKLR